jgi:hypothetical protein
MTPLRKAAIKDMLARIDHRQALLQEKCVASLVAESGLDETVARSLVEQWLELMAAIKEIDDPGWQERAVKFGAWCATRKIPFEVVMAHLHSYKRAAMPLLVREYPGVEGYLEAHLALDEALTLLMGKIPPGYFESRQV